MIHEQYKKCGLGDIPPLLEIEEVQVKSSSPLFRNGKETRYKNFLKKKNFNALELNQSPPSGQGHLRTYARDIVIKICNYQEERDKRRTGGGFFGDPTSLLLEELKWWTIEKLSVLECGSDLLTQVKNRIRYVTAIESSGLFEPGFSGKFHLSSTLLDVLAVFKTVEKEIEVSIDTVSAEKELANLMSSAQNFLQQATQYLYFILRDEPVSNDFTFANVRALGKSDQLMQKALHTKTGSFLVNLVKSAPFTLLFKEVSTSPTDQTSALATKVEPVEQSQLTVFSENPKENFFLSNPKDLLPNKAEKISYGVYLPFLKPDTTRILIDFIELHGLLLEFARFVLICGDLKGLAALGGNILMYGLANESVSEFVESYFALMKLIDSKLCSLHNFSGQIYEQQRKGKTTANWLKNYTQANTIYYSLKNGKEQTDKYAQDVLAKAKKTMDKEERERIRQKIINVLKLTTDFSSYISTILGGSGFVATVNIEQRTLEIAKIDSPRANRTGIGVADKSMVVQKKETENKPVATKKASDMPFTDWSQRHIDAFSLCISGFRKADVELFGNLFESDVNYFANHSATEFCVHIANIIREANKDFKSMFFQLFIPEDLKNCLSNEISFLKYLCINAVRSEDDGYLLIFAHRLGITLEERYGDVIHKFDFARKFFALIENHKAGKVKVRVLDPIAVAAEIKEKNGAIAELRGIVQGLIEKNDEVLEAHKEQKKNSERQAEEQNRRHQEQLQQQVHLHKVQSAQQQKKSEEQIEEIRELFKQIKAAPSVPDNDSLSCPCVLL